MEWNLLFFFRSMEMKKIRLDDIPTGSNTNHTGMCTSERDHADESQPGRHLQQLQQPVFEDITMSPMDDLEKFYADERWRQGKKLSEAEQRLVVKQLQSLLERVPIPVHLRPIHKILEFGYYYLVKILEQIEDDMNQSACIDLIEKIEKEEEEKAEEREEFDENDAY